MRLRTIDSVFNGNGTRVKDIAFSKFWQMFRNPLYFYCLYRSLRRCGQTVPLAVGVDEDTGECYLVNGHHRVVLAWLMHWPGMLASPDPEQSVDHAWNEQHNRGDATAWDW
jgi:hypothetical protein